MVTCPYCQSTVRQVKAGMNNGIQRYKCLSCKRRYTQEHQQRGYSADVRTQAINLYNQGAKVRHIARELSVNHQTVANWINAYKEQPITPPPKQSPAPMQKRRSTISDVAQKAGVSVSTISNYINNKGRMSKETRKRIKDAMDSLNFTPSALMKAIRQQRSNIFGALIFGLQTLDHNYEGSITPPLIAGLTTAAAEENYDMLLYTNWNDPPSHAGLKYLNGHIDGLVWVAPNIKEPVMDRIAGAGLPVIALLSRHVPSGVGYINSDNIKAMHTIVDYLVSKGHRRIAYIGPSYTSNFKDRREGFYNAMTANNCEIDEMLDYEFSYTQWDKEGFYPIINKWSALKNRPTAIVAADDHIATVTAEILQENGLRIPEDIAVTGFNDTPSSRHTAGGITTIRQSFRELGKLAAERLMAMVDGAPVEECRITIDTELIIRKSA